MLELEFLGIQPDGNHMTLNDSDGNRYSLPITGELRAALRRDRAVSPAEEPKPMSPRDIQAHFRAGRSLEELSDMTMMPASQLSPYEYPIIAERQYTANQARNYRIGHEIGSLTVEELVTSRLRSRDVNPSDISWSAVRQPGKPWTLTATYTVAGRETTANWSINQDTHSLSANNDEARWLSETEIPIKDSPWRPLTSTSPTRVDDEPVVSSGEDPAETADDTDRIVSMLDSLSARRGTKQQMTMEDHEYPPAAHPPASRPDQATDAAVLSLPPRPPRKAGSPTDLPSSDKAPAASETSARSTVSATTPAGTSDDHDTTTAGGQNARDDATDSAGGGNVDASAGAGSKDDDGLFVAEPENKPKRRRPGNRPAMPSWDEIVFGHPKD